MTTEYWQGVLSRLSVPGLILLVAGAALGYGARWIAARLWKQGGERAIMPLKVAGIVLVMLGALILTDIIPI